jgi:predicted glycosyltransferase
MTSGPVWIDLANSPHVLFFGPVIAELERRGVRTTCTARDFSQTLPLLWEFGLEARPVGSHGGAGLWGKGRTLVDRTHALRGFARQTLPSVALSHNSYAQGVAARSLGVPTVTAMDYEFQPANHLAFRCASLVAVPDCYPLDRLRLQGARPRRTWRYPGFKEHISLAGFTADPGYLASRDVERSRPLVVVRPPADMALYHRFENPLFGALLRRLTRGDVTVVLLARTNTQAEELEAAGFGDLVWHGEPLDGRQLVAGADLVVSAGGSMNREAAVLGTPACSIYAGQLAAVDRVLIAQGRLTLLQTRADVERLPIRSKPTRDPVTIDDRLVRAFVDRLLSLVAS